MRSHHITYDSKCTVPISLPLSDIASTASVSSQPLYWWSLDNCIYDITLSLCMASYALYITSHPLFMISHHCSHHITSTEFMISHTLYMTSHTRQHDIISAISPTISDTASNVSVSSNPVYQLHHIHSLDHIPYTICMTSYSVCMTWHELYDIRPLYVWHDIQYIYDIISYIYDITHTAFMTTQCLYLTSPPLYLTSEPLYLCHHTDDTHMCFDVPLYRWHHNKHGSRHNWYTCDIIHIVQDITFTLYDISDQYLWHHNHCIHDIRSPLYGITSNIYDISSTIPVTSQLPYL